LLLLPKENVTRRKALFSSRRKPFRRTISLFAASFPADISTDAAKAAVKPGILHGARSSGGSGYGQSENVDNAHPSSPDDARLRNLAALKGVLSMDKFKKIKDIDKALARLIFYKPAHDCRNSPMLLTEFSSRGALLNPASRESAKDVAAT
jgi:hypothetical protein